MWKTQGIYEKSENIFVKVWHIIILQGKIKVIRGNIPSKNIRKLVTENARQSLLNIIFPDLRFNEPSSVSQPVYILSGEKFHVSPESPGAGKGCRSGQNIVIDNSIIVLPLGGYSGLWVQASPIPTTGLYTSAVSQCVCGYLCLLMLILLYLFGPLTVWWPGRDLRDLSLVWTL